MILLWFTGGGTGKDVQGRNDRDVDGERKRSAANDDSDKEDPKKKRRRETAAKASAEAEGNLQSLVDQQQKLANYMLENKLERNKLYIKDLRKETLISI